MRERESLNGGEDVGGDEGQERREEGEAERKARKGFPWSQSQSLIRRSVTGSFLMRLYHLPDDF